MDLDMRMQNADKNAAQNIDECQLQRMGDHQAMTIWKPRNAMNRSGSKQVNFALLIPVLEQQLDKDRAMQLQRLYVRLKNNNINKEDFVRRLGSLVGDHMLKTTVYKLQKGQLTAKPSMDNNAKKQRLLEHQSDSHGVASDNSFNVNAIMQERDQPFPMQHIPFPQPSFPNYGNAAGNYSSSNMNMSSQSFKQIRQGPVHTAFSDMTSNSGLPQSSGNCQLSMHKDQSLVSSIAYAIVKQEPLDQINDQQNKSHLSAPQGSSLICLDQIESSKDGTFEMMSSRPGFSTSVNEPEPMPITERLSFLIQSAGGNGKTFSDKPTVGQKKPLEAPVSSPSKKQKVSGAFSDQSIDQQLSDVTDVSEVILMLEKVQAELEKEREARQIMEARFEQFEQEREKERAERERELEQERAEREREHAEQAEWRKTMEEMLKKALNK